MTTTIQNNIPFLNARTGIYTAWQIRNLGDQDPPGAGVAGYEDFRVMQRQAGANLSVDIGKTAVGAMRAWIRGSTRGQQGLYIAENIDYTAPTVDTYLAQLNEAGFSAADPTNPRIDRVVLRVLDQQHDGGGSNLLQSTIITGTPTGGTTLDTLAGAAAVPASSLLLADVLIPAAATTVVTANIQDRRGWCLPGGNPVPITAVDAVTFQPHPSMPINLSNIVSQAGSDAHQAAVLMYLPRRIKQATRIRTKYRQGGTAANTFYQLAIFDASGRVIVATGAATLVYTGATGTTQAVAAVITATDFEPGWYYVWVGNAAATAGTSAQVSGAALTVSTLNSPVVPANVALFKTSGGVTVPNRLTGYTDLVAQAVDATLLCVPVVTLSVG